VFFHRKRRRPVRAEARDYDLFHDMTRDTAVQPSEQLSEWRQTAHRVTGAWNYWLAADRCNRDARYHAFVSALADEERAAAKAEALIQSTNTGQCATPTRC
jgi:hypothetical protein